MHQENNNSESNINGQCTRMNKRRIALGSHPDKIKVKSQLMLLYNTFQMIIFLHYNIAIQNHKHYIKNHD